MPFRDEHVVERALEAMADEDYAAALACFESLPDSGKCPAVLSNYALCIAFERGDYRQSKLHCLQAIRREPKNSLHYLNYGRIQLLAGQSKPALATFRQGLRYERNEQIIAELDRIGPRRPPLLPFLSRDNPANKFLGQLLHRIRPRTCSPIKTTI